MWDSRCEIRDTAQWGGAGDVLNDKRTTRNRSTRNGGALARRLLFNSLQRLNQLTSLRIQLWRASAKLATAVMPLTSHQQSAVRRIFDPSNQQANPVCRQLTTDGGRWTMVTALRRTALRRTADGLRRGCVSFAISIVGGPSAVVQPSSIVSCPPSPVLHRQPSNNRLSHP